MHTVRLAIFKGTPILLDSSALLEQIQNWGRELGFSQIGIAGVDLSEAQAPLLAWLERGFQGEMHYMQRHGLLRTKPVELHPGTMSIITARMNYLPSHTAPQALGEVSSDAQNSTQLSLHSKEFSTLQTPPHSRTELTHQPPSATATHRSWREVEWARLQTPSQAVVSVYARGRDYHKVVKQRLELLAQKIAGVIGPLGHRVFTDSAPVMEVQLATQSGLGWRGKHTLALNRKAGSMFFLGEIFINQDLTLSLSEGERLRYAHDTENHCGTCQACMDVCPTQAIVAPYVLDARKCISYLTIEHKGSIAPELRPLMGNRIYGCDDCQLICPWNKYAQKSNLPEFDERSPLQNPSLIELWNWSEGDFERLTEGQAIRRIGHERWLRNLAIALGNALRLTRDPTQKEDIQQALARRREHPSPLVREHVQWALAQEARVANEGEPSR
jgi:epoxyqueuosine reductase